MSKFLKSLFFLVTVIWITAIMIALSSCKEEKTINSSDIKYAAITEVKKNVILIWGDTITFERIDDAIEFIHSRDSTCCEVVLVKSKDL